MNIKSFRASLGEYIANQTGLTLLEIEQTAPDFWGRGGVEDALRLAGVNNLTSQDFAEEVMITLGLLRVDVGVFVMVPWESVGNLLSHLHEMNIRSVALWQFACNAEEWKFKDGYLEGPDGATVHPSASIIVQEPQRCRYGFVSNYKGSNPKFRLDIGEAVALAVSQVDANLRLEAGPVAPGPSTLM